MTAIIEWSVERYNELPQLPPTDAGDPNLVYLRAEFNPEEVELAGDGVTPVYKLSGRYYYSFLDASKVSIQFPTPAYMDLSVAAALSPIPASVFSQRLNPLQQQASISILKTTPGVGPQ
jgi:hypothetical protein